MRKFCHFRKEVDVNSLNDSKRQLMAEIIVWSDLNSFLSRISSIFCACRVPSVRSRERPVRRKINRGRYAWKGNSFHTNQSRWDRFSVSDCIGRPIKLIARKLFDDDAPQCVIVSLGSAYYINMPCVRADCWITKSEWKERGFVGPRFLMCAQVGSGPVRDIALH